MQLTLLAALLPLVPLALAETKTISVGEGGLVFKPDSVTAAEGDKLEFHFYPRNHSIAQSSFDEPCVADDNGIWSDFIPVASGEGNQTFTVTINGTDPLWLYCSQGQHCAAGMAMVVNPPSSGNTLEAYLAAAKNAQATSPEGSAQGGVVAAASSTNSTSTNSTSSPTSSSTSPSDTGTAAATGSSSAPALPTTGAAVRLEVASLGVLGLVGLVVGGMI